MKKKVCQYCYHEFDTDKYKRTAEHIIPKGIIELFPDQYISYVDGKAFVDNNGITISDVCKYCNGTLLSPLDSYGKTLIKLQFLDKIPIEQIDCIFDKTFDGQKLSRWLIKIIFNERRSKKLNCDWFDRVHGYMLNGLLVENFYISVFAGIHINTTPLPEEAYDYLPMQINEEPKLFGSSLGIITFGLNPYTNSIVIPMAKHTYCIRFGTAVFYCILWDKEATQVQRDTYNHLLDTKFNFTRVVSNKYLYHLKCISAHSNTTMGYRHLLSVSGQQQDRLIVEGQLNGRSPAQVQQEFLSLQSTEKVAKGRALVEASMFPNNKKILSRFEKQFGID